MSEVCPVCSEELAAPAGEVFETSAKQYQCPNCGAYELSFEGQTVLPQVQLEAPQKLPILSHAIRVMSREEGPPHISLELVQRILDATSMPTPIEQLENLILWIGGNMKAFGESVRLDPKTDRAAAGAANLENFVALGQELVDRGWFDGSPTMAGIIPGRLTLAGWQQYEALRQGRSESRMAFMAMPFGDAQLDMVFSACFKPAVKLAGFDLRRLDESPPAGLIDDRLRVEIRRCRFTIADLTYENRGVYWEAGFAEGLGKPVIYTCEKGYLDEHKTHFDTNHHLTIGWAASELEAATAALVTTIRATLPSEAVLE